MTGSCPLRRRLRRPFEIPGPKVLQSNLDVRTEPRENRCMTQIELDHQLFMAVSEQNEDLAMKLLEQGGDPASKHFSPTYGQARIFERAIPFGDASSLPRFVPAMLGALTREQKDELLLEYISIGRAALVEILLKDGADPHQKVNGCSLYELAPNYATDLRRMLLAAGITTTIESAMPDDDGETAPPPATKVGFTL